MKKYQVIGIFFLLFSSSVMAQILSPTATDNAETQYNNGEQDLPVYLYSDLSNAQLIADTPSDLQSPNYKWSTYNSSTGNWTSTAQTGESYNLGVDEGAYKVEILDNITPVDTQYCWVFIPEIQAVEIDTLESTCSQLVFEVKSTEKELNYYSLDGNNTPYQLEYQYDYTWMCSSDDVDLSEVEGNPSYAPAAYESAEYFLDLGAFNGAAGVAESAALSIDNPIAVKALFTQTIADRSYDNEIDDETQYSAPVNVAYTDESQGYITDREWLYLNSDGSVISSDQDITNTTSQYTEYGSYYAQLSVYNRDSGCESTFAGDEIDVIEMLIDVPNTFTPNGDGINDQFMVVYQSIKDFKMIIVNRAGRKVFETKNPGDFWDGSVGGSIANNGVYFYYIEARGYNEGEYVKLSGALNLLTGR